MLRLGKPIEEQLHRRRLHSRTGSCEGDPFQLRKIIEWNSSLRVGFGWSFESASAFDSIMREFESTVTPSLDMDLVEMISDSRCDWIGFVPFNIFDQAYYEDFGVAQLINFNNKLIDYQISAVTFLTEHPVYKYHTMVRDAAYRFEYFRDKRKDPIALGEAFQYYIDAVQGTSGLYSIDRSILEEMIGCHYLYHPDVFFELLEFHKLKGTVYE